jgi:transcriptional regulator with XRE-family HTH domain
MPKIDESAKEWQKDLALRVGAKVQARRKELGLTALALAERTGELGYPISRVAVGKIETGHREGKLDLAELVVLAAALGMPPVMLVYPDLPHGSVEVLPGRECDAIDALAWFSGDSPRLAFRMTERFGMAQQDIVNAAEPLLLSRDLTAAEAALVQAQRELRRLEADWANGGKADAEGVAVWTFQAQRSLSQRAQTIRQMRAHRLPVHSDYDDDDDLSEWTQTVWQTRARGLPVQSAHDDEVGQ